MDVSSPFPLEMRTEEEEKGKCQLKFPSKSPFRTGLNVNFVTLSDSRASFASSFSRYFDLSPMWCGKILTTFAASECPGEFVFLFLTGRIFSPCLDKGVTCARFLACPLRLTAYFSWSFRNRKFSPLFCLTQQCRTVVGWCSVSKMRIAK